MFDGDLWLLHVYMHELENITIKCTPEDGSTHTQNTQYTFTHTQSYIQMKTKIFQEEWSTYKTFLSLLGKH